MSIDIQAGDCCELLEGMDEKAKLIVADPPYNYGQMYADFNDKRSKQEYTDWTVRWLSHAYRALDDEGSMFVFVPDEWAGRVDVTCQDTLGLNLRNWIVWHYTFGQNCRKKFNRCHTHILYYTKDPKKFTFNRDDVKVPSARQRVYNDKRAADGGKNPDDVWVLSAEELQKTMGEGADTWLESRICGTFKERDQVSPNQLPLQIVDRIVLSASNPGDLVVDPFVGTGTTAVSCSRYGRRFVGFDVSSECRDAAYERVKREQERNS